MEIEGLPGNLGRLRDRRNGDAVEGPRLEEFLDGPNDVVLCLIAAHYGYLTKLSILMFYSQGCVWHTNTAISIEKKSRNG